MVVISPELLESLMQRQECVRNISIIAHVDHGKTTLTDSLLSRAGLLAEDKAGTKCSTDTREDEKIRGITIKSTAVSVVYDYELNENEENVEEMKKINKTENDNHHFLVNLIDSPGHVDFSSEVTAALRVSDGALVVVDCVSGVCIQTETVLRQALTEQVRVVLVMNKLDRLIVEKQMDGESVFRHLSAIIRDVNKLLENYGLELNPVLGNVTFGCGLHGWGFNLGQIARFYAAKFNVKTDKFLKKLWNVNNFDKFVLQPIYKVLFSFEKPVEEVMELADKLDVQIPKDKFKDDCNCKDMCKYILRKWMNVGDAMVEMIVKHLPSPVTAQKYRTDALYEGPLDDLVATGMRNCDRNGPLMMYVSKMIPSTDSRFLALGRVFSGTLTTGQKVSILGPDYDLSKKPKEKNIARLVVMQVGNLIPVDSVACGSICAVYGIDKYVSKTACLTTYDASHALKMLKFTVSPVVRCAVNVKNAAHLPQLIDALKRLHKSDPMLTVCTDDGQQIIAAAGELHLEVCLADLEAFAKVPILKSKPIVAYSETVLERGRVCLAKSGNKHNRIWIRAEPLGEFLVKDIENKVVYPMQDSKERSKYLCEKYDWNKDEAKKIWCFGPNQMGPNLLVDCTRAVQGLGDVKDMVMAAFQWVTSEGLLAEESLRGIRFDIMDAQIHSDSQCRGGGQIIPAARRAFLAAMHEAKPRLCEPIFSLRIDSPSHCLNSIYSLIHQRRGNIVEENQLLSNHTINNNNNFLYVMANLPVSESFGFNAMLRSATHGKAFEQCWFSHWKVLESDPFDKSSVCGKLVKEIRCRKGGQEEIMPLDKLMDKL